MANRPNATERLVRLLSDGDLHTLGSLTEVGFDRSLIHRAARDGLVWQVASGIYGSLEAAMSPGVEMAALTILNPDAVVCLLSAASVHDVSDELPGQVWMAIPHAQSNGLRKGGSLPCHAVWWHPNLLTTGIETRSVTGVDVRVTNMSRTVVDMIRYRDRLGDEPAMKSLHDFVRYGGDIGDLWTEAKAIDALHRIEPFVRAAEAFQESVPVQRPSMG